MGVEIERKFLVDRDRLALPEAGVEVRQGYLSRSGTSSVRVRYSRRVPSGQVKATLTIKGPAGLSTSTPVVIQGESGAGKTTLLASAARRLAAHGIICIPVSIAGRNELNLLAQAESVFRDTVDRYLRRADEGDTVPEKG